VRYKKENTYLALFVEEDLVLQSKTINSSSSSTTP